MNFLDSLFSLFTPEVSYIIGLIFLLILTAILYSLRFTYVETFTDSTGCQVLGTWTVEKCGNEIKISAKPDSTTKPVSSPPVSSPPVSSPPVSSPPLLVGVSSP